jgi:hypothetical protein
MHRCKISLLLGVMNWWSPNASILSNQFSNLIFLCYAYSENAGLLGLTRVGSRRVVQISAGFMLFFSVLSAVFHIAIFYSLFMNELNFISHGNQCFRFSFCPVMIIDHCPFKKAPYLFPIISTWSLYQFCE